jgi:hypothetical protein
MSRKSRMQSVREAKDKRAKMMAIGGVVVLAAVLAFELPHVLKKSGGSTSSPPAATTTSTAGTSTAPATSASGTAAAVLPASSTKLPNSDVAPRRSKAQLFSFSHFASKDPFVQQVSAASVPGTAGQAGATSGTSSGASGAAAGSTGGSTGGGYATTAQRTLAKTGAVAIQINGKVQTVRIGASFPSSNPLFKLVSVNHGVARIGIASGSYASGAGTVSLSGGRTLTLVDTSDGVRYKLELVSAS